MNESKYRRIKCRGRNGYFDADEIELRSWHDQGGHWDTDSSHVSEISVWSKRIGDRAPIMLRGASGYVLSLLRQIVEDAERDLLNKKEVQAELKQMWIDKKHPLHAVMYIRQLTGWMPSKCKKYVVQAYRYYEIKEKESISNIPPFHPVL